MTWIKICGITSLEDAQLAVEAGVDALGFVFAESSRRVTPEQAREIIAELPAEVEKVGVFVRGPKERIEEIVEVAGLTGVQLHHEKMAELVAPLRNYLAGGGRRARILHVWRLQEFPPTGAFGLELPAGDDRPDAVLLDSKSPAAKGGTGTRFDWKSWGTFFAQRFMKQILPSLIVAGGLTPENVGEAIRLLRPWGVDVVTGVEREPGKKDPEKVHAFVNAVRQADKECSRL